MKKWSFPLGFTPFDLPLLVFLVTAGTGVWAAYDRPAAWAKFGMIVSAVAVYYAVAWQPEQHVWRLAGLWEVVGAGIAGYFLLTFDWQKWPTDLGWLTRLGVAWMALRPTVPGFIHPNVAGGLLVMLAPFAVALEGRAWHERRTVFLLINTLLAGLILLGLLFTSSRGAWAALAVALGLWGAWSLITRLARWQHWSSETIFAVLLVIATVGLAVFVAASPGGIVALVDRLPGAADGLSRYEMAQGAWRLAGDFPFTGGGLAAFSGLYSTYILVIFVPLFTYSHNFFLDVAVEQGWFGLLALAGMLGGSVWLMVRAARHATSTVPDGFLRWAVLSSLVAVCLHGLLDDALYGNGGTPLIFVTAGMAVAVGRSGARLSTGSGVKRRLGHGWWPAVGIAGVGAIAALLFFWRPLLASGYANLGAVRLAQLELAGWPDNRRELPPADLAVANGLFRRAVSLDPHNRTAQQRLGQLAWQRRDFSDSVVHLELAFRADAGHRGVRKALGYAYVWLGRLGQAAPLLRNIPEAAGELETYAWWWGTQGREDLARQAGQMADQLKPASP